jgi:hypothetical protein
MGKWIDLLLGTTEERKKKQIRNEEWKNALQKQKENNMKIRTLYLKRNQEEKRLRKLRTNDKKTKK